MNAKRLPEADPGETIPLSFDFTTDLGAVGATAIVGTPTVEPSVDNALRRNTDPTPADTLNGSVQVVGNVVIQSVNGLTDGVDYKFQCWIDTDNVPPQRIAKTSILPVRAQ
jgi:hypothetical protein